MIHITATPAGVAVALPPMGQDPPSGPMGRPSRSGSQLGRRKAT